VHARGRRGSDEDEERQERSRKSHSILSTRMRFPGLQRFSSTSGDCGYACHDGPHAPPVDLRLGRAERGRRRPFDNYARAVVFRNAVYVVGGGRTPGNNHGSFGSRLVDRFAG